ncbi:MAG: molybdopterin-dependent oxidoreductase [Desulfobacteraceae bacterium]|nr:molybdopterin-dependent oxidoreductase [Desulfobacteraceae bacterium]
MKLKDLFNMLTACTKDCPDSCSIIIKKKHKDIKVMGNPEHPVTKGFTCAKLKNHINRLKSSNRITSPMYNKGGVFEKISWDQALDICSEKITNTLNNNPKKMLHIQDHGARGVSKIVVDNFFTSLGCTKTHGSLCDITGIQACINDFGGLDHNDIDDIQNSTQIVNFGKDFSSSSIHLSQIIQKARKKNIHVTSIWPGGGGYNKYADKLILINPGTDRFLVLAIIKLLKENNNLDQAYIDKCSGRNEYFNLVNKFSLSFLSEQCGVPLDDIKFLADIYKKNNISTILGWGIQRHLLGMETVRHINALSWLSGNIGYQGAGAYFNISSIRNLELDWIIHEPNHSLLLPVLADEIEQCNPEINIAWISCSNVVNQAPDSKRLFKALKNIDFTIVVDAFMTDTAAAADLILPCTLMFEEDDVVGSCMHSYLQYAKKSFTAPEGCRSDFAIAKALSQKLNSAFSFPEREKCLKLSFPKLDNSISFDTFKKNGFIHAGKKKIAFENGTEHKSGFFSLVNTLTLEPEKNPVFPMRLLSLINKEYIHSQILPEEQEDLPVVTINPDTEHIKNLNLDEKIYLVSCLGKLEIKIRFDKNVHLDVVIYRRGDWMLHKGGVNSLIEARLTDSGTGAAYYGQQIKIEN